MNAPFLLPGLDSRTAPDRPPAIPATPPKSASSQPASHHEAELAAELASVLRRQPRGPGSASVSTHRPALVRREPLDSIAHGSSLKNRLDAVDWRDGQALPPPSEADIAEEPASEPEPEFHETVSAGHGSSAAWLKKARRDRQLARLRHAVSWAVTLVIGGTIFAVVAIMLFGPGRVMAALNKLPL